MLSEFFTILARLEERIGGRRRLGDCHGRMKWPNRGVYFFFEEGEHRFGGPDSPRVVRVGTHAVSSGSRTTLWKRLAQHRGSERTGGGNHRGSIFRLLVGEALAARDADTVPTWGKKQRKDKAAEADLERRVSEVLRAMTVLWLPVADPPSRDSQRAYIERNAIALLSGSVILTADTASASWLGRYSPRPKVRASGLWNQRYVGDAVDPDFIHRFSLLTESFYHHDR